jgi:hypothetical protein
MPPVIVLAAGAFAAGAIVHRLIKEGESTRNSIA